MSMLTDWAHYNKFWVAAVMAILVLLEQYGFSLPGVNEHLVNSIVVVVGAILVYAIPNRG